MLAATLLILQKTLSVTQKALFVTQRAIFVTQNTLIFNQMTQTFNFGAFMATVMGHLKMGEHQVKCKALATGCPLV